MKLKNLFLASIAVAAMTACSNETEFVDNGNQTVAKDAAMQFGISLPKGALSRAGEGVSGKIETGIPSENEFDDITVVIDYPTSSRDVYTFDINDFTKSDGADHQTLYLKNSIAVQAGKATVSAFVNASDALKADLKGKVTALNELKVTGNYTTSIDDLTKAGGIAQVNKFLMSGSESGKEFKKGEEVPVSVKVNRVAAKLVEKSKTDAFTATAPTVTPKAGAQALAITLQEYNFANLAQDTYILNTAPLSSDWFNQYADAANTSWDAYKTPKTITGATPSEETANITYCTENRTSTTTLVLYKAVAKWGDNEVKTFYITPDKTVYLTFEELSKNYNIEGLTENSSIAEFAARGIKKYEDGVCYYKSDQIGTIERNNVYYLNVTSIADLGEPTPGETETPSTINLTVAIQPWTINFVEIEL